MSEEIFNLKKLEELMPKKIDRHFNLVQKIEEIEQTLKETLKKHLDKPIDLEIFLSINEGLRFREIYQKNSGIELSALSRRENKPLEFISNKLKSECDIIALKNTRKNICSKIKKLIKMANKKNLSSPRLPVEWIESFEDNFPLYVVKKDIAEEMDLIIKVENFGLNEEKVRNILCPEKTVNEDTYSETINFEQLLKKLNISREKTITYILNSNIGVYVKESGNFSVKPFLSAESKNQGNYEEKKFGKRNYQPISSIVKEIEKTEYDYPRYGHVRLVKRPCDSYFWGDNVFFEQFYKGSFIENAVRNVPLESSLAEHCLGIKRVIKLKENQKITLNDLIFFEDEVNSWLNRFDRKNFYSEHNAKIIEEVLSSQSTTLNKIASVGIIENASLKYEVFNNLKNKIIFLGKKYNGKSAYQEILYQKDEVNQPFTLGTKILSNWLFKYLIDTGFLQKKWCRLPRLSNEKSGFTINPDYYPEYDGKTPEEIVKDPKNYVDEMPSLLRYSELVERWAKYGIGQYKIRELASKNKLGIYLIVDEKYVLISPAQNANDPLEYLELNSGNPFYLKRYKNIQKIPYFGRFKNHVFCGEEIFTNELTKLEKHTSWWNFFETTDIETKHSVSVSLKSFNGKNKITFEDLVFLVEEIEKIEKCFNRPENDQKISTSHADIEMLKDYEAGKNIRKQKKTFAQKGALIKQKQAIEQWQKLQPNIIEMANKNPTWSMRRLATNFCNRNPDCDLSKDSLRKKIMEDQEIRKILGVDKKL